MAFLKRLRLPKRPDLREESGQSITEYVLLLAIIVSGYMVFMQGITRLGVARRIASPITQQYKYAFKYGHVLARGPDEGGYNEHHPRYEFNKGALRIFINPTRN